ncbi:hypothetical protein SDJN02_10068, partial [Cucurbita argyrosperma subsp. argyrosperma]
AGIYAARTAELSLDGYCEHSDKEMGRLVED